MMRPRKPKHPKYKAYFDQQLRIMQERFPFLSIRQIKAKILTSWQSFSPEKKDDWGNKGNSSQGSDGTGVSPPERTPQRPRPDYGSRNLTSPRPKGSAKKVRFSRPPPEILGTTESPVTTTEHLESPTENSQSSLPELGAWPILDEFNLISKHKLVVEQKTRDEESQSPQDDEFQSGNRDVWPAFFGDSSSILKSNKTEIDREKEQPMCGLFQKPERKNFSQRRILAGLSPSEVQACRNAFEGENDDDIFA